ncbi:MAG: hypothetical protein AVDCRST_MAG05-3383, partial [uncultured Rubrobacteraceae bacterium]
ERERRAEHHGASGNGRARQLERAGARGPRQVLLPAHPGQRRRRVRHKARGRGRGRPDRTLQGHRQGLLRHGAQGRHLRKHPAGRI